MIVVIDNKDSFTYNLVGLIARNTKQEVRVIDVDHATIEELESLTPNALVISPGPGVPKDYPILYDIIRTFEKRCPILGVCLGFQLLIDYYGGEIIANDKPVHGHTTSLIHHQSSLFEQLPQQFNVMRYHSLMVDRHTMPSELYITAENNEGVIMAVAHHTLPIVGVQYHPESILSEYGAEQIQLFLNLTGETYANQI